MGLRVHSLYQCSVPWLRLNGVDVVGVGEHVTNQFDFFIIEQPGDGVNYDRFIDVYGDKAVFILSGDHRVPKSKGRWFVNNTRDHANQIWMTNPRLPHQSFDLNTKRDLIGNFRGKLWNTPTRRSVLQFKDMGGWVIQDVDFWTDKRNVTFESMVDLLKRSIITLCPKGKGRSSMRIVESLCFGSIPVLIDDDTNPFDSDIDKVCFRASHSNVRDIIEHIVGMTKPQQLKLSYDGFCYFNDVIYADYKYSDHPWSVCSGFGSKVIKALKTDNHVVSL